MNEKIRLSEKHGVNPSLVVCRICGKDTNSIALLGKLKNDKEAPKTCVTDKICDECQSLFDKGMVLVLEHENEKTPTGRSMFLDKNCFDSSFKNKIVAIMSVSNFSEIVKQLKNKQ